MTTGEGTGRLSTSEAARMALAALSAPRVAVVPDSHVTISTSVKHGTINDPEPKRLHSWEVGVRGEDAKECARLARLLDNELAAAFAHELDNDTLAGKLAASVIEQREEKP